MERTDEKILKMMNDVKEQTREPARITDGPLKIGSVFYQFEEVALFDKQLHVFLPDSFVEMDDKHKKLKYPHEQRPAIVKTDATGAINFTFSYLDEGLTNHWVQELTEGMRDVIKKTNPSHVFYATEVELIHGNNIGYFEFKSPALDDFIYNIMYFMPLGGKTMMGTFCCLYKDYSKWRDIALQVIRSIRTAEAVESEV